MKVRELQEKLGELDPELDVIVIVHHAELPPFEVEDVSAVAATRSRGEDGMVRLKFEIEFESPCRAFGSDRGVNISPDPRRRPARDYPA